MLAIAPYGAIAQGGDADAIFERARTTWSDMTYPSLLDYRIAVAIEAGGKTRTDHYAGEVEPATGACRVHAFSAEEAASPTTPRGINVVVTLSVGFSSGRNPFATSNQPTVSAGASLNPPKAPISFGTPDLSPLYSFGMRAGARRIATADDDSGGKLIGRVLTLNRRYAIRLLEETALDGTDAYHLALEPIADPARDRLRELWIATNTYDVLQARVLGNFTDRPATTIPWLIRFVTIDGATYIASETSEAPLPERPATLTSVAITFEQIAQRHGSRDLLFAIPHDLDARGHVFEPNEEGGRGRPDRSC